MSPKVAGINQHLRSGAKVIATASKHNWNLLRSLGAEEVFDYKDPECGQKIRSYTNDLLNLVLDCIAEGSSPGICEQAVSSKGGTISCLLVANHSRKDVEAKYTIGYTCLGEAFDYKGRHWPAVKQDLEFSKKFWPITEMLISEGKLKSHPAKVGEDGLKGCFDGFQQFRENKVSGVKLVYRVEETP